MKRGHRRRRRARAKKLELDVPISMPADLGGDVVVIDVDSDNPFVLPPDPDAPKWDASKGRKFKL